MNPAALSTFGTVHTLISVIAVLAGFASFFRNGAIVPGTTSGKVYIWATVLTCLTGFFIFKHGSFGKPHGLGVFTLLVLAGVWLASQRKFGKASIYIQTIGLTFTFFLHSIPGFTETGTRLPLGAPLFSSPEDPSLQKVVGLCFLIFLVGAFVQYRRLKANKGSLPGAALA